MTRVKRDNTMLTTRDVASLLNVDINTVRRWTNHGILKAYRVGPRRDRRFRQEDINLFLMNNHVKTPAPVGYHSKEYIPPDESKDVGGINNRR
jgi:excisionase family DNA binding protein